MKKVIAIDPGLENGVAVYDDGELTVHSMPFWKCINFLITLKKLCTEQGREYEVMIENASANNFMYSKHGTDQDSRAVFQRKARNVGMNNAYSLLIIEFCKDRHIPHIVHVPTKADKKIKAEQFFRITNIRRSNQHERDAGMLIVRHYRIANHINK